MNLYLAPLEGITDPIFRRAHAEHFGAADKYFTPFLSPNQNHRFSGKEKRDVLPENNAGLPVVPQLLTNSAEHFLWAARELRDLGYREINLNLGCPSGTVTAKKKGAGFLADPARLDAFFDEVFSSLDIGLSVKTRFGMDDPAEFEPILEIYNRYPLTELIIHPRVRRDFYGGAPDLDAFARALDTCRHPVCYNGDLFTPAAVSRFRERFPGVETLMLGRGVIANPGLLAELRGEKRMEKAALRAFHDRLYDEYRAFLSGERNVLCRMKELWHYLRFAFEGSERYAKALRKAGSLRDYEATVNAIFRELPIISEEDYPTEF